MKGLYKGLATTLKTFLRKPVTVQYPGEHLPLAPRFMGFPRLLWDEEVGEPRCVGDGPCQRICPTQCIRVTMKDNEKFKEGKSKRRKIVDTYELDQSRCLVCGLCVEVCNFHAITMSQVHLIATTTREELKLDKEALLLKGQEGSR